MKLDFNDLEINVAKNFKGGEPTIDALLKRNGIKKDVKGKRYDNR